ncbi:acidic leucine-rich nuclear phosphoprotein 32 family member E-like [Paramacrobiotus metropolitanus]|uniref:acidic leucine-rich nuclear phosphoprotein 32 family member E-like n=1 Tax=Paramacrobiotus metropolitanus TaxID=2943436 RepID=UPI002445EABE|nr:acidic leucine-rich nuclear phosphoprotein 32 family member E-like [Paramacrobiotus metropolitanus]
MFSRRVSVSALEFLRRQDRTAREIVLDGRLADDECLNALQEFRQLEKLAMVECGLNTLDNLPALPNLRVLIVNDNGIKDGLQRIPQACPKLQKLSLAGNRIADWTEVVALSVL